MLDAVRNDLDEEEQESLWGGAEEVSPNGVWSPPPNGSLPEMIGRCGPRSVLTLTPPAGTARDRPYDARGGQVSRARTRPPWTSKSRIEV